MCVSVEEVYGKYFVITFSLPATSPVKSTLMCFFLVSSFINWGGGWLHPSPQPLILALFLEITNSLAQDHMGTVERTWVSYMQVKCPTDCKVFPAPYVQI